MTEAEGRLKDWPGFWMNEQSGVLRPIVELYLSGLPMNDEQVEIMRLYLVQWIEAPVWKLGESAIVLQARSIKTRRDISRWIHAALDLGIDPL